VADQGQLPVLESPANRHRAVGVGPKQVRYTFANTLSAEESENVDERYHVPAPGRWVWNGVLANIVPGHQDTWVNYGNEERAPLLFLAGGANHIVPAAVKSKRGPRREIGRAHRLQGIRGPRSLHGR
jgi:hypothetical protein